MMSLPKSLKIFTVDAFTSIPFAGNPAAVCLVPFSCKIDDNTLQKIAAEMNISETAFLKPVSPEADFETASKFGLRWFTPTTEVNLCGHATLATSAVLFHKLSNKNKEISFETLSGILKARLDDAGDDRKIGLDFPINIPSPIDKLFVLNLIEAVVGNLEVDEVLLSESTKKLLVVLDSKYKQKTLESLTIPDSQKLLSLHDGSSIRGIIVSIPGSPDDSSNSECTYDFLSRYFAPWNGILEDPVCGSAHTVLGPYWSKRLGKKSMSARQCSPRGGDLTVIMKDENTESGPRTFLYGTSCIVLGGLLMLPA